MRLSRPTPPTARPQMFLHRPTFLAVPLILLTACLLTFTPLLSAHAALPGDLDGNFGTGGKVTTDFGANDSPYKILILIQTNGKIVAVGLGNGFGYDFVLARYNADGSLDTTFNGTGKVNTDFGGNDYGIAGALQPDGKIIAAGYSHHLIVGGADFALARYNEDGSLDNTFGTGGKVTTTLGTHAYLHGVAIQPDGKIVAAGWSDVNGGFDIALARYNSNGSLDSTFGSGGLVTTDFGGANDQASAMVIQPDGKIVVLGYTDASVNRDFAIARYNPDGSLDTTFNGTGKVITDFGGDDFAYGLAMQADGTLVVAGYTGAEGLYDFVVARYNQDGTPDATFNGTGKVITDLGGNDLAYSVAIQGNNKIVVSGTTNLYGTYDFAIARYNENGSLDTTFGAAGLKTIDFGGTDQAASVAIQADSKIITLGPVGISGDYDFGLARELNGTDVSITKTVNRSHAKQGDLTYTVTVNNDITVANNVVMTDPIPAQTTYKSGANNCTHPAPGASGTITCNLNSMASWSSTIIKFTVTLAPNASGTVQNTATVTTSSYDINQANNSASASTIIDP